MTNPLIGRYTKPKQEQDPTEIPKSSLLLLYVTEARITQKTGSNGKKKQERKEKIE